MRQIHSPLGKSNRGNRAYVVFALYATTAIAIPAQTLTTLYSFCSQSNCTDGAEPVGLVQGTDGNLYGTAYSGGYSGGGAVFKITADGALTTLASFPVDYEYIEQPSGLIQATDGNFYGTTWQGGSSANANSPGFGTIFEITPAGSLTTFYSFCSQANCEGNNPVHGLLQATDGNFYGTTQFSPDDHGTIFKISPAGALTTLYQFCPHIGCADGTLPQGLIQATDGDFYGTTPSGGAGAYAGASSGGDGTVFKMTPGGTLTTLYSFCSQAACADGNQPTGLIQAADGNFYGTTAAGGAPCAAAVAGCGTVFKITPSGTLTTLYSFCAQSGCADGTGPGALIQATDGNFYGITASGGGANDAGTVFKITPSGTLTTLYSFCAQSGCPDGSRPVGMIQVTDGNLYGITGAGGATCPSTAANLCGTIFRLSAGLAPFVETLPTSGAAGTAVQILGTNLTGTISLTFNGAAATFTVVSNTLITTTVPSGASTGEVQVTTPSGTLLSNVAFVVQTPPPPTVAISGQVTIYGSALTGVTMTLAGSPSGPVTTTTDASGNYSFSVAPGGSYTLTPFLNDVIFTPSSQTFSDVSANQTQDFTAVQGSSVTATFTTLYSFCSKGSCLDGKGATAALIQGTDGNFYGAAVGGGANDDGTFFSITPGGTMTTIYTFCSPTSSGGTCTDGAGPQLLVEAANGSFYGITGSGGSYNGGTVFEMTPSGTLTTLYTFCSHLNPAGACTDGGGPSALIQANDGNLYGAASATVFKLAPSGALTTLYTFCSQPIFFDNCPDGDAATALVQATDGNFYGTTTQGGPNIGCSTNIDGCGTVFKLTPNGTLTTLYSFCAQNLCTDGYWPATALVQGTDGDLYGTTSWGGANGYGTVFKITPNGALTTIYSFCTHADPDGRCIDGGLPNGLLRATDGNFYGTTIAGGASAFAGSFSPNSGTVFKITPSGTLTTMYSFCSTDAPCSGNQPEGALLEATSGDFYGTTSQGGADFDGTIFSLSVGMAPFVETLPTSGAAGTVVQILGTNLTGAASVTFNGTAAAFTVVSSSLITATVPSGASTGEVQVTTSSGTLVSNIAFVVQTATPPPTFAISGQVTLSGNGLSGVTMTLTGSASGPVTTTTDGPGNYSFSVPAGASYTLTPSLAGDIFSPPSATVANLSGNEVQNFTANAGVGPLPPAVNAGGVLNSASYTTAGVAPGSLVSIFGTNMAVSTAAANTIPLPTALSDVTSVTFNGIPAGLYFVSQNQINAQLPFNVLAGQSSGTTSIVVTRSSGTSAPQSVTVVSASPGIFTTTANGSGQAFAYNNTTGAVAAPAGTSIGSLVAAPISISSGDALIIACTGLGAVNPSIEDYLAASDGTLRYTVLTPTVLIGGVAATPIYSVLSPQFVSEYQIGVTPAANTPTGDAVSLQIQIGGVTTTGHVTIAVAP